MNCTNPSFRSVTAAITGLAICLIFALESCNSDGAGNQTATTTSQDTTKPSAPKAANAFLGDGKFAYLALTRETLDSCFNDPGHDGLNAKKIVFRFSHDGQAASHIVIDGFLTNPGNNNYIDGTKPLLLKPALGNGYRDLSGNKIYLSDLEMTREQYRRLRAAGSMEYLVFIPFIMGDDAAFKEHCVNYNLFWVGDIGTLAPIPEKFANDNLLNPSPPAHPQ